MNPLMHACAAGALVLAGGCALQANAPTSDAIDVSQWSETNSLPEPPDGAQWHHQRIGARPASRYTPVLHQGRPALKAESEHGDSLVRLPLSVEGENLGMLRFSLFANALNPLSDLADSQHDDAIARVILQFGGDRSGFSLRDNMVSDLLQTMTGQPLPFASLVYVWDHRYPAGTVIPHRRTARIKTLVIESGPQNLGRWLDVERDVTADYIRAFGHPPANLEGIALMTDSNNTKHPTRIWYGPLIWRSASAN